MEELLPVATRMNDGIMAKEDFRKLPYVITPNESHRTIKISRVGSWGPFWVAVKGNNHSSIIDFSMAAIYKGGTNFQSKKSGNLEPFQILRDSDYNIYIRQSSASDTISSLSIEGSRLDEIVDMGIIDDISSYTLL